MSDAYYEPNIKFLIDMEVTNNYSLFKEELKYWVRSESFAHKLYLKRNEENIVFKDGRESPSLAFSEKDGKVFCFLMMIF